MSKVRIGSGNTAVYLDDAMAEAITRTLRGLAPTVVEGLEQAATELKTAAERDWPVSRKQRQHSRDQFETGIELQSDSRIGVYLKNEADYAFAIKSWQGKLYGQSPWIELVRKPAFKLKSELARQFTEDLVKLARGR